MAPSASPALPIPSEEVEDFVDSFDLPPLPTSNPIQSIHPASSARCYSVPKAWIFLLFTIIRVQFGRILSYHERGEEVPDEEVLAFLHLPDVVHVPATSDQYKSMLNTLSSVLSHDCNPRCILDLANAHKSLLSLRHRSHSAAPTASGDSLSTTPPVRTLPIKRIRRLVEKNCPRKALNLLQSEVEGSSMLQFSPAVVQKLRDLFPPASTSDLLPPTLPMESEPAAFRVDPDLLDKVIRDLPRESDPGMSGWTFELIQQVCKYEGLGTLAFAKAAAPFLSALFCGHAGPRRLWARSKVLPLEKKDGGIRPIAIGESWMRLLSGYVARQEAPRLACSVFAPIQFGVGVPGGAESVIHSCQLFSQLALQPTPPTDLSIQQIDFRNAFNEISRRSILSQLESHARPLIPLFRWAYGDATPLYLASGNLVGTCERGVRQGDPLGPLFFSLGLHPVLAQVAEEFPQCRLVAYMDDVSILGPAAGMQEVFARLSELAWTQCHLRVNKAKSIRFQPCGPLHGEDLDPACPTLSTSGILCLGTPVGTSTFELISNAAIVSQFTATLDLVKTLESPVALPIVRCCVNTRATYLTRTSPPRSTDASLKVFDAAIDSSLLHLLGSQLPRLPFPAHDLRNLPLREGGLGIRRMHPIRDRVWLVSFLAAMNSLRQLGSPLLADFHVAQLTPACPLSPLLSWAQNYFPNTFESQLLPVEGASSSSSSSSLSVPVSSSLPVPVPVSVVFPSAFVREVSEVPVQREVCKQLDRASKESLMQELEHDPLGRAWVLANTDDHVGNALFPNLLQPALNLPAEEHATLLNMRLLMPAVHAPGDVVQCGHCLQGQALDDECEPQGPLDPRFHSLVCRKMQGMRTKRHDAVVFIVHSFLRRLFGANQVGREVTFASLDDGTHPDLHQLRFDLRLTLPQGYLLLDVTVVCPSCVKHANNASVAERRALLFDSVRQAKVTKYRRAMQALDLDANALVPLVFEASGKVEPKTAAFLQGLLSMPSADRRAAASYGFTLQRIQSCISLWAGRLRARHHARRLTLARTQRFTHAGDLLPDDIDEDGGFDEVEQEDIREAYRGGVDD